MRKISVLLFLVAASAARALSAFSGSLSVTPFTDREAVVVGAGATLILQTPGTYTATNWNISGELRLDAPGNYILVASSGAITINAGAKVSGPALGLGLPSSLSLTAHLALVPTAGFTFSGTTDRNVTISQSLTIPSTEPPPLVNISTRSTLSAGQTVTSGFVVGGKVPRMILIRAIGPTLATFGITNALATPTLTLSNAQTKQSWTNSGWNVNPSIFDFALPAVFRSVGAFPLPDSSRDAALNLMLAPGSYTVQVSGGAGEVLTEIYYVDETTVPPTVIPAPTPTT
jgi:hypothetical protein